QTVQATAAVDVVAQLHRFGEGVGGRLLDRGRWARPDLAGHAQQATAQTVTDLGVGQAQHPKSPPTKGQVLAQAGGDDGAFGCELGGTVHLDLFLSLLHGVDQVAVDLVRDDHQIEFAVDLGQVPYGFDAGDGAGGVVGRGDHDGVDLAPLPACVDDGGVQKIGLGYPPLADGGGDHDRVLSQQAALCCVTDPAGSGDRGVATQFQQQAVQQRFAAGTGDDHCRVGRQSTALPVSGGSFSEPGRTGDRPVGVDSVAGGELLTHRRVYRQPGL